MENFKNYFKKTCLAIFWKILRTILEYFENHNKNLEINFELFWLILQKFSRISQENFENLKNYFRQLPELFYAKILRNISEIIPEHFENNFKKFRIKFWKNL